MSVKNTFKEDDFMVLGQISVYENKIINYNYIISELYLSSKASAYVSNPEQELSRQ